MDDTTQKHLRHLTHLCSRSEKSIYDIRQYCVKHHIEKSQQEELIDYLTAHHYIDEERYANAFVHDAFHLNHWGRLKIRHALMQKNIPPTTITKAIETQIHEADYKKMLKKVIQQKKQALKSIENKPQKQKIINFARSKGFEPELIIEVLTSFTKK